MFNPDEITEHFDEIVEEVAEMAEVEPEVVEEVVEEPEDYAIGNVVDCKRLRIRKSPDADSAVLKEIENGTEVMIDLECSTGDFYSIVTESGVEGFCMKKFIKIQ